MSHEHSECNHDLSFCKKCDVAYCQNCPKEWGAGVSYQPYWQWWPDTVTYPLNPITSGGTFDVTIENPVTSHTH